MQIEISKALIIQTAFLGDVVLATPLIESLKEYNPNMELDFLVRKGNENLLIGHPKLRKVLVWDKSKKYGSLLMTIKQVRKSKYELVINLQRFFNSGLITFLSGSGQKVGFSQNPFSFSFDHKVKFSVQESKHEVDRNLELIEPYTSNSKLRSPKLYPGEKDFEVAKKLAAGNRFITISPASIWFTKQVPIEVWKGFIKLLPPDLAVLVLGSGSDFAIGEHLLVGEEAKVINLCGKTSLLESAALMKLAVINYCNDSAPLHLASALDAPSCAVYCSTIPQFGFGPLSTFHRIVEIDGLDCRPCGLHGRSKCPLVHFNCGNLHQPTSLLKAYEDVISCE